MPFSRHALAATAVAALAIPTVAAAHGTHAKRLKVTGQQTVLHLDDATTSALTAAGVTVTPTGKATASDAGLTFPVAAGRVNAAITRGFVIHRGGIALAKENARTVRLRGPVAVVRRNHAFVAVRVVRHHWRGHVLRVFTLSGLAKSTQDGTTTITGTLHLTRRAARLFNRVYGTTFAPGAEAGSATTTLTTA
jgi:hypothetical protein